MYVKKSNKSDDIITEQNTVLMKYVQTELKGLNQFAFCKTD